MKTSGIILLLAIAFAFSPKKGSERPDNIQHEPPKPKIVLLDYYFNNEWKKDSSGRNQRFHYVWEDKANSGFYQLGEVFKKYGFETASLEQAPSKRSLKDASVYIIVDPDTEKETEHPNYITNEDADVIVKWVKKGGVLMLMGNDSINANLKSLNVLSERFGIHFNEDLFNPVQGKQWEQAAVMVPAGHEIFTSPKKLYLKEVSTLRVQSPATTILSKDGTNIMAIAKYGKGTVFAVGDPWIYNEYIDNHILSADFENGKGADDLVRWIAARTK
jgi:unsaturated rhamnogalacturonyl hydrolase